MILFPSFSATYFAASAYPLYFATVVVNSIPPINAMLPVSDISPASVPAIQPICCAFGKSDVTFLLVAFSGTSVSPFNMAKAMSGYSLATCKTASVYSPPGSYIKSNPALQYATIAS